MPSDTRRCSRASQKSTSPLRAPSICSRNFLEGVAAHVLASEAQVPGDAGSVAQGLKKQFGLSDEAIAFYAVHDHADEEHSGVGTKLLATFARTDADLDRVVNAVTD